MATNVYSPLYQSAPCDYEWYQSLKTGQVPDDLECLIEICDEKSMSTLIEKYVYAPTILITNLFCKKTAHYYRKFRESSANPNPATFDYDVPVYDLIDCSVIDEIDPLMLDKKIPNATFSFKMTNITPLTPLDEVTAIVNSFMNNKIRIKRGFYTYDRTKSLYDENGEAAFDYYEFQHDVICLGNYYITKVDYNYETNIITAIAEQMTFSAMDKIDYQYATYWNEEYPYPYGKQQRAAPPQPDYVVTSYILGVPAEKLMTQTTFDPVLPKPANSHLPLWTHINRTYGFTTWNTRNILALYDKNGTPVTVPDRYALNARLTEEQTTYDGMTVTDFPFYERDISNPWELTSLCYRWKKEPMFEAINMWCLMNDFHYIPMNNYYPWLDEFQPDDDNDYPQHGCWGLVSGTTPSDDVFLDKSKTDWTIWNNGSNGIWYPALKDTKYFVTPAMLLAQTTTKDVIDLDYYQYLTEYQLDVVHSSISGEGETPDYITNRTLYYATNENAFANNVDLSGSDRVYPSNQRTGYVIGSKTLLEDDKWYFPISVKYSDIKGHSIIIATNTGQSTPKTDSLSGLNLAIRGNYVVFPKYMWNTNISTVQTHVTHQPYIADAHWRDAAKYNVDINGNAVPESDDNNSDSLIIDSIHSFYGYKGLAQRVLKRANGHHLNPLYKLSWTQIDDPSMRVGNVVYVPLQNQYVKVHVIKQERSFDGGARLQCEGWVLEETNIKVYDPAYAWLTAKQRVVASGPDKGEWIDFTWQLNNGWMAFPSMLLPYEILYYINDVNVGSPYFLNSEQKKWTINVEPLRQAIGEEFTLGDDTFRLWTRYPYAIGKDGREYWEDFPFIFDDFDNTQNSLMYSGQIVAGNAVVPLTHNHWMVG